MRIFLAGATGVIGRRLVPLLRGAGHDVWGTTRAAAKAAELSAAGVTPVIVDVFDADVLRQAVVAANPDVVIHQLTDLPRDLDPAKMAEAIVRNARIRRDGSRNLVDAAVAAGVARLAAQSIAWAYAPGTQPFGENQPLDLAVQGQRAISVGGVAALEDAVLSAPLDGVVLRYGHLYGPGTGADRAAAPALHVDAAAQAALLAIGAPPGIYNIAEDDGAVSSEKTKRTMGWCADFRIA